MRIITIGRHENNDITIKKDSISRLHAKIELHEDGKIYLEDVSLNGTTVKGELIRNRKVPINKGDDVRFAGTEQLQWGMISNEKVGENTKQGVKVVTNWKKKMPLLVATLLGFLFFSGMLFKLMPNADLQPADKIADYSVSPTEESNVSSEVDFIYEAYAEKKRLEEKKRDEERNARVLLEARKRKAIERKLAIEKQQNQRNKEELERLRIEKEKEDARIKAAEVELERIEEERIEANKAAEAAQKKIAADILKEQEQQRIIDDSIQMAKTNFDSIMISDLSKLRSYNSILDKSLKKKNKKKLKLNDEQINDLEDAKYLIVDIEKEINEKFNTKKNTFNPEITNSDKQKLMEVISVIFENADTALANIGAEIPK